MGNPNYEKGRRKEYKVMHQEKRDGCIVVRSSGSHSPIDIVSINVKERTIKFIQCKPDSMSENKREALRQANCSLNGAFQARFDVI